MKTFTILMLVACSLMTTTVFSQEKAGKKDKQHHTKLYVCPMHSDVTSTKPGHCSKCGMNLELSKKEQMKKEITKNYTCPIHADVLSDKPGQCPQCGKDLMLSPKEKMKSEVMKKYTCPMHKDVTSDKPGKCPKCGMSLTKAKEDHSNHQH